MKTNTWSRKANELFKAAGFAFEDLHAEGNDGLGLIQIKGDKSLMTAAEVILSGAGFSTKTFNALGLCACK